MAYVLRGTIKNANALTVDTTLTQEGYAADSKAVGDAIESAKNETLETLESHVNNKTNPHTVTASQIGLGNVNNTSDADKPVSTAQAAAIADAKKAGTDAQALANNALISADEAKTAASTSETNAKNYADVVSGTAETNAKNYADSLHKVFTATIPTAWTGSVAPYTQEVTVSGILATDNPHVTPVYSDDLATALLEKEAWAMVSEAEASTDAIIFTCFEDKPTTAISVEIEVNR